jgi:PKD domain
MRRRLVVIWVATAIAAGCALCATSAPAGAAGDQQAGFSIQNTDEGLTVNFVAVSSGFPDGVSQYLWTFGDGMTQPTSEPQVTHNYMNPGEYQVELKETAPDGSELEAPATMLTAKASGTLMLVQCTTSPCTAQITHAKTIHLLETTGSPTSTGATIQLFAGTYQFAPCLPTISPAVGISDSGFSSNLTVKLKYTTSDPSGVNKTCFSSTIAFTDKQGNTVDTGLLPSCTKSGNVSPCVQSISHTTGSTKVTKQLIIPAGDPKVGAH